MLLNSKLLFQEAKNFCHEQNMVNHPSIYGINDGKTIGTYIEHEFKKYLSANYEFNSGSSAKGIDFPDDNLNTDMKVTSIKSPQSSSPFKNVKQKIYGLGHNLLIFVYDKKDIDNTCKLNFKNCTFIDADKTGDYTTTKRLIQMIEDDANNEDIFAFLNDKNLPGDDITLNELAWEILENPPNQGYLTISNALQWRLQYKRVIHLDNDVEGVLNYEL